MDLKSYTTIIFVTTFVPAAVIFFIGAIVGWFHRESEALMLIVMKGIITRKNVDHRPTYFVCNRKLPSSSRQHFFFKSLLIISLCVQCFFLLAITDVTYQCIQDPDVDCFKKKDDVKLSDTYAYDESPVNCSSISIGDFVICYRISAFDPERAFIGAAAGYLLFKMLNFSFLLLSYIMIGMAQKFQTVTFWWFKFVLSLILLILLFVPLILRVFVDEVESAVRKLSFTVFVQASIIGMVVIFFVAHLPWEKFRDTEEYYGEATSANNADERENEMGETNII